MKGSEADYIDTLTEQAHPKPETPDMIAMSKLL